MTSKTAGLRFSLSDDIEMLMEVISNDRSFHALQQSFGEVLLGMAKFNAEFAFVLGEDFEGDVHQAGLGSHKWGQQFPKLREVLIPLPLFESEGSNNLI